MLFARVYITVTIKFNKLSNFLLDFCLFLMSLSNNRIQGSRFSQKSLDSSPNFSKQRNNRYDSRNDSKSRQLSFLTLTSKVENVNIVNDLKVKPIFLFIRFKINFKGH